jgi:hypothetical protein
LPSSKRGYDRPFLFSRNKKRTAVLRVRWVLWNEEESADKRSAVAQELGTHHIFDIDHHANGFAAAVIAVETLAQACEIIAVCAGLGIFPDYSEDFFARFELEAARLVINGQEFSAGHNGAFLKVQQ